MARIAKPSQVGEQLTLESVVGLVMDVQFISRATSLALSSVGVPVPLAYQFPSGTLDICLVLF